MRVCFLILFAFLTLFLPGQQSPVPQMHYRSVPNFLKLPSDLYLGEVVGVAVNSKGHIFVFSRGNTRARRMERVPHNFSNLTGTVLFFGKLVITFMRGRLHIL